MMESAAPNNQEQKMREAIVALAEFVESIARFVETWGGAQPNKYGRPAELAKEIRERFMPKEDAQCKTPNQS